jgi:parallel beta-helix repeat protein
MKQIKMSRAIFGLFVFGAFLWLLPSAGEAQCTVNSGQYTKIQDAVDAAPADPPPLSPTVISVSGTCNESVFIDKNSIILNGGGSATIQPPLPTLPAIRIAGNLVTIKNFAISGGPYGIAVMAGGNATIDNNTIQNAGSYGVLLYQSSSASITNNTIKNSGGVLGIGGAGIYVALKSSATIGISSPSDKTPKPNTIEENKRGIVLLDSTALIANNTIRENQGVGILLYGNSFANIGIVTPFDTSASPNDIENNGDSGIAVKFSSAAQIVGNTICNNEGDGVEVSKVSQADISDNDISGNTQNGIFVTQNSGVNLGNEGVQNPTIFDLPNTSTAKNGNRGIQCDMGGYVDGLLGTLSGIHGSKRFGKGCINSTQP